ncbi:hypothetical protein IV38_GL001422 [Lactobacillus selangorensis]|nr:hypothetical protein [Lactobacillus selangorensis]KRN28422.1 hypothetical protein IV38_GL001422 [Lactobacillus selangorensis]
MDLFTALKGYRNWLERNALAPNAQVLWFHILMVANEAFWPEHISIRNSVLMTRTNIQSEKTLQRNRDVLVNKGLIKYHSGGKRQAGIYELIPFPTVPTTEGGQLTN